MNKNTLYILAAALLLLPGCNKALDPVDGGAITVHAGIGAMTKVTTDGVESSFVEGDQIAVYAWTGSAAAVPAERVVDGVVNTLGSDGKWSPASQMLWKAGSDAHYFLGVSPVRAVSDFTADAVTLSGDYASDDLLFARQLDGLKPGSGAVALTFEHAMARLTVNLKVRNEFGASPAVSVSVTAKSGASVNYLSQAVTATGDASARSLTVAATATTGYTHSFVGIQVPQEGVRRITVTVAGQDIVYEAGEDIPLTSGHHTTLGLIVGKDKIDLSGVSVGEWTAGAALPGGEAKRDFTRVPLTFEAQTAGAQVSFTLASGVSGVQYSTDGWTWTDYVSNTPITLANVGDVVLFRGDNAGYYASSSDYSHFSCTEACSVYGNIMSLVSSTDFATATTLTADYAFRGLFSDNADLRSDASKELVLPATTLSAYCYHSMFFGCSGLSSAPALPATTLTESCYEYMFEGCTGLTTAPALPATTLAGHCYRAMFYNCSGLTTAPALPATTLANGCYNSMFYGCSGLATAPALPATTLAPHCYECMFKGCTGLTTAPALPATTLANGCYVTMFSGCSGLVTAPALPATTLAEECYRAMFYNCSGLTTAPALPATTLAYCCYEYMFFRCTSLTTTPALPATTLAVDCYTRMFYDCSGLTTAPVLPAMTLAYGCYDSMFYNCANLASITCAATDISAPYCTKQWLDGVAATGTFIGSSEAGWTENSSSGIPSGWTFVDAALPLTFEAQTAGAQVSFTLASTVSGVQYSTDGSTWMDYVSGTPITLANVGDMVMFRGDNAGYYADFDDRSHFSCTEACSVYGNIMSLVSSTNFATATTLTADDAFRGLFSDNADLRSDATKALVLPATTLSTSCYSSLFVNCTGLTSAPALPATTLAPGCYDGMFSDCTGLTSAPALPATTLQSFCYKSMFQNCISMTTAPELPATTLSNYCYYGMFEGCSNLTTAPELPATTLVEACYYFMFRGCSNLNSITCAATDITAIMCTEAWLFGVADSGTFTTPSSTGWTDGEDGIPDGWTRVNLP